MPAAAADARGRGGARAAVRLQRVTRRDVAPASPKSRCFGRWATLATPLPFPSPPLCPPLLLLLLQGAYYDWYAYEPNITSKGVPQDVLVALHATFSNGTYGAPPLPVSMYMLDAYWMPNVRSNGNCLLSDDVWDVPFPKGLQWLSNVGLGGAQFIIYNGPMCGNTTFAADWPLVKSLQWDQGWGSGVLSAVAPVAARAFYDALFARRVELSMGAFTQVGAACGGVQ